MLLKNVGKYLIERIVDLATVAVLILILLYGSMPLLVYNAWLGWGSVVVLLPLFRFISDRVSKKFEQKYDAMDPQELLGYNIFDTVYVVCFSAVLLLIYYSIEWPNFTIVFAVVLILILIKESMKWIPFIKDNVKVIDDKEEVEEVEVEIEQPEDFEDGGDRKITEADIIESKDAEGTEIKTHEVKKHDKK